MPTVIDSLLITLGLETSAYKKGQKEAEDSLTKFGKTNDEQTKKISEQAKKQAEAFNRVKNEVIGMLAAIVGAKSMKDFIDNTTKADLALGRVAKNLDMGTARLAAWGDAAKTVGGTAEGIAASFQSVASGIESFALGKQSSVVDALSSLTDASGTQISSKGLNRNLEDIFKDIAGGSFSKMKPQDQIRVKEMLGLDEGTFELLRKGETHITALVADMEKHRQKSGEASEAARKLTEAMGKLDNRFNDIKERIYKELAPGLSELVKHMTDLLDRALAFDEKSGGMISKFVAWGASALVLITSLKTIKTLLTAIGAIKGIASGAAGGAGAAAEASGGASVLSRLLGAVGLSAYSGNLNEGEDEAMKKARAGKNGYDANGNLPSNVNPDGTRKSPGKGGADFSALETRYGLRQGMLDKIWSIESGRGKNMVSPAGATGHFQFMPGTAKRFGMSREDTFDLGKSSEAAAKYLSQLLKRFKGDEQKAVMSYNWGEGNIERKGVGAAPKETRDYWSKYTGAQSRGGRSFSNTSETHINGPITVNTQATDAAGVASGLRQELQQRMVLSAADTGMN